VKYIVEVNGERIVVELDADGVRVDGERVDAHLADVEGTPVKLVTVGAEVHRVVARRGDGRGRFQLSLDGYRYDVEALDERSRAIRELAGPAEGRGGPAPLIAPMPGLVIRINVKAGDAVQAGQGLVVMEAMKMENELRAPAAGTVRRVGVEPVTAVEKGTVLVELE